MHSFSTDQPSPEMDRTQENDAFFDILEADLTNRFGASFVQKTIPDYRVITMQWFTKQGGHATVIVTARDDDALKIEFTRSAVIGAFNKVEGRDDCLDIKLYTGAVLRISKKEESSSLSVVFRLYKVYTFKEGTKKMVMDLLLTLLAA